MFETMLGAIVLVVAGIFLTFAYSSARITTDAGYEVTATFDHIDGTREGGEVRISGIKVGSIISQQLDPKTFQAVVKLKIFNSVQLPVDTVATITSSGLLGDKYMQLIPGADDKVIPPGGTIRMTQPPISLESLLGQFVYSMGGSKGGGAKPDSGATAPAAEPATPQPSAPQPSVPPTANGAGKR
jgi:phospholipid/cholesterol/gamma-HCH transport system substrate-binding protein